MTKASSITLFLLRVLIGWLMFYAGWSKVVTYFTPAPDWTAKIFLANIEGPFAAFFQSLSGNYFIDYLNAYGLLLVGIAVILGLFTRFAAFWGIVLMALYYLASYPPEHAFLVDEHIIYIAVFLLLGAMGAGRVWGVDAFLEKQNIVEKNPWLTKILG